MKISKLFSPQFAGNNNHLIYGLPLYLILTIPQQFYAFHMRGRMQQLVYLPLKFVCGQYKLATRPVSVYNV